MKKLLVVSKNNPQLRLLEPLKSRYQIEIVEACPPQTSAEAVLAWDIKKEQLEKLVELSPAVKWIHSKSAGVEGLLGENLKRSPIVLTNAQGVFADSLAEFAITGMLYFAKFLPRMNANKEAKRWEYFEVNCLKGATLGILGYGGIGQQIAKRALAFGMKVISFRTKVKDEGEIQDGVTVYPVVKFDDLVGEFDYLSLSLPATPETLGFLSAERIRKLKQGTVLVNVGRGTTVDEEAMISALREDHIFGAALDVFAVEPLPETSPLWQLDNVLLSPHTADRTATWLDESMEMFVENAKLFSLGQPLKNIVDKTRGY